MRDFIYDGEEPVATRTQFWCGLKIVVSSGYTLGLSVQTLAPPSEMTFKYLGATL